MRNLIMMAMFAALAAAVYATCNEPSGAVACTDQYQPNGIVRWPCCDQSNACPANGSKWARFIRQEHAYFDGTGKLICVFEDITSGSDETGYCCGDPWPE